MYSALFCYVKINMIFLLSKCENIANILSALCSVINVNGDGA